MTAEKPIVWLIILCATLIACGDEGQDTSSPPDYDDPESSYVPPSLRASSTKSDSPTGSPVIKRVEWMPVGSCNSRTISTMRVRVTIEDSDTELDQLHIEGSVTGCSSQGRDFGPVIRGSTSDMLCHHVSVHTGLVTVIDPAGNADSMAFRFGPCDAGHTSPQ